MPTTARTGLEPIGLVPATPAQQQIIANLLQFYIYDFSEIMPLELAPDGRFQYPELQGYWSETSRFPFLAAANGKWVGLVFVKQVESANDQRPVWDMAEFFVLRGYRRLGLGTRLAHLTFQRFPGAWQIRVMESNAVARYFWEKAIEDFTGTVPDAIRVNVEGASRSVFRFESKAGLNRGPDTLIPSRG